MIYVLDFDFFEGDISINIISPLDLRVKLLYNNRSCLNETSELDRAPSILNPFCNKKNKMQEKQEIIKNNPILSVQDSAKYLGVSRSSFWRKAKSDGFPSKVIINNKVGYRPEDLEEWHSKQVANREAKRSGVPTYEYLGKAQFILKCHDLARDCVRMNAIRKGTSILEAERLFEWTFDRLKDSYVKVFPQGLDSENFDYEGKPWKDFIEAKEEIIKLVWPEIDTDDLTEEDILRF